MGGGEGRREMRGGGWHARLREEQHAVALRLEVGEELVQKEHLAGGGDDALDPDGVGGGAVEPLGMCDALDQERVVAAVAELHRDVVERRAAHLRLGAAEEQRAVLLEDRLRSGGRGVG